MVDFQSILTVLAEAGVEFIVVGGVAGILHGSARLTQDVDVVYRRSDENLARLVAALSTHAPYLRGAPPGLPFRWDARTLKSGLNFTLSTDLGPLDLLGHMAGGPAYEDIVGDTNQLNLGDVSILYLGLKRLIMAKKAAGRPKDLEAIAELTDLLELQDLDRPHS